MIQLENMKVAECESIADKIREQFNPDNLSPFPYRNVSDNKNDLEILLASFENDNKLSGISGATIYNNDTKRFSILINEDKPKTRQNFTIAHELGHYFLHDEILKDERLIIDDDNYLDGKRTLYRLDEAKRNQIEIEANNFAASLLMPRDLVVDAWKRIGNIQECAEIFSVSAIAMTIRLERLGLIE